MSGIYIHIPFCRQACHYCNFHFSTTLKYKTELIECIGEEITMTREYLDNKQLKSIYLGGGTPSLLNNVELTLIFDKLKEVYKWDKDTEISLEANPDDINRTSLELWQTLGINRLSVGIQSFFDKDLLFMNRAHNGSEAFSSIRLAREFGYKNLSVDLIYGSPTTTDEMWLNNIKHVIDLEIPHISSYCLTVEQGTALAYFVAKGKSPDVDQVKAARQFDMLIDTLENCGYEHYEISNFAKNNKYSIHNSNYWKGASYLGVGPGAHSFNGNIRRWNIANNMKYLKAIKGKRLPYEEEVLSEADKYNEYIITRLRTKWGVKARDIQSPFLDHFSSMISILIENGYVKEKDRLFLLTRKGKHFADRVAMELMVDR